MRWTRRLPRQPRRTRHAPRGIKNKSMCQSCSSPRPALHVTLPDMLLVVDVASYLDALEQVVAEKQKLATNLSRSDALAMELQARLEEKEARALEIQRSFMDFKREIARNAENSRSGKPIPRRIIMQVRKGCSAGGGVWSCSPCSSASVAMYRVV